MSPVIISLLFILGIVLIIKGGDIFVDAASWFAEVSGIPKFIVGATIVSFATTMPELLVSAFAAAEGKVDMSVGNAVGSVTANLGIILAISLLCIPSQMKRRKLLFKGVLMCAVALLLSVFCLSGTLSLVQSVILLALFVAFMIDNIREGKTAVSENTDKAEKPTGKVILTNVIKFVLGAAGIVIGADLLVDNGSELAKLIGISERVISVTIIAIGTSLPELITTITAIVKKQSSLSVGNIIGANIFDLTLIMPICAVISGGALPVSRSMALLDIPVCFLVCLIAVVPALIKQRFYRWQGVLLLVVYSGYMAATFLI